jgi:ABC-2 type transport system ATP-binding protein
LSTSEEGTVADTVLIETKGLRKSFKSRHRAGAKGPGRTGEAASPADASPIVEAVRGVDLTVGEGEIFGFLGPNGAGKTTTLRMLATLLAPDGGEAKVAGYDLRTQPGEVRKHIGYVAQGGSTWDESTAREELVLQARLYGLSKAEAQRRADRALAAFQLAEYADRRCKTYSGGQRRRVDIALGIIHGPKIVFLDEPTTGLDPQSRAHMWDEVRRLRAEGMTVFLTTHYLDEADALCDRLAIMDHGQIVAEGTPAELKRELSGDVLVLGLGAGDVAKASTLLARESFVNRLETTDNGALRLFVDDGAAAIPLLLRAVESAGIALTTVELHRPSLDDVFLAKTGRSLRES